MRGEHARRGHGHRCRVRFIPACAGNTATRRPPTPRPPVHPRMRGEHYTTTTARPSLNGSSPHARGTRAMGGGGCARGRFIPACAGNTFQSRPRKYCTAVHPRMRGEHARPFAGFSVRAGSSPHARGTLLDHVVGGFEVRFIPACAGNTPDRV